MKSVRQSSSAASRHRSVPAAAMIGMLVLVTSTASWAALRAHLERTTVQEGDTLTLSIDSDRSQSGERPDVTPLRKDFDVLGTSTSSETAFVNGSRSDRTHWLVRLQPRHTGTIDIPPISVGGEQTAALQVNVTEPSPAAADAASKHVFLEAEIASPGKSIYVQQQIPYTIRLYYDDTIQTGELAAPAPGNAIVEQLGEERHSTATRNGREFNVIERRYAIAPEKSGTLHIPPATFHGSAAAAQNGQGDTDVAANPMERFLRGTPFANDPFFKDSPIAGMAFGDMGRPVAARSQEIRLDVQPRPAAAKGNWLPAEQITLHDSWEDNPPELKAGEPVTRTITVEAKGLAASQIPPLSLAQPVNARLYPEAPDNQSRTDGTAIYGISKQSVTYVPAAQGTLSIPPIELAWWNTRSNAPALTALPARDFKVAPGVGNAESHAAPAVPTSTVAQAPAPALPMTADHPLQNAPLTERLRNHWTSLVGGAALLAVVILSGVVIWRSRRRRLEAVQRAATGAPVPQRRLTMRALRQACLAHDRHAAAHALLDLARAEWPNDPPRSLSGLAARLEAGRAEILGLDRSLYGADGADWKGDAVWEAFRRGLHPRRSETWRDDDGLAALYRQA
jgi:hypothetical protein